jgi:hypothetical protein
LVRQFRGVIQFRAVHLRAESSALQVLLGAFFPGAADLRRSTDTAPPPGETRKSVPFVSAGHFHERLVCGCRWAGIPGDRLPHVPQAHGLRGVLPNQQRRLRRRPRQRLFGRLWDTSSLSWSGGIWFGYSTFSARKWNGFAPWIGRPGYSVNIASDCYFYGNCECLFSLHSKH